MQREYCLSAVVGLSVVALVAAVTQRLPAQEVYKTKIISRAVVTDDGQIVDFSQVAGNDEGREPLDRIEPTSAASRYWIGVKFFDFSEEASEALRSQLNLEKGRGLVVSDVVAESPAAKAGLKKYDVIVTVGEQPVGKPSELVKAVDAAKQGELKP